ncbi:MAG: ribonuclease HI [Clostridiales bacterium]|jgi:ribonuclease HI|nr:ribonuclease HI [Clostridiales bacterium]
MKQVEIYTDGACSGNPGGPGGWGAILSYMGREKEISGFEPNTTNNRMELMAAIKALECLKEPCGVRLHSDSAYVVNAFAKGWIRNWMRNGWRLANDDDVKNTDLWQRLAGLAGKHSVTFVKVRGHSGNELNERCDKLATGEISARKSAGG